MLEPGSHACVLYRDLQEHKDTVLSFVLEGLKNGEQCIYVVDEQPPEAWGREFQEHGVDVAHEAEQRNLIICTGEHWRGIPEANSVLRAKQTWSMIQHALDEFAGIRFVVDAGWMLDPPVPVDALCHWEATLNPLIDGGIQVRVLCQYNIGRHSAPAIHAALRTHPIAFVGGNQKANPYYEAPLILEREPELNYSDVDPETLERMLTRLCDQD